MHSLEPVPLAALAGEDRAALSGRPRKANAGQYESVLHQSHYETVMHHRNHAGVMPQREQARPRGLLPLQFQLLRLTSGQRPPHRRPPPLLVVATGHANEKR